MGFKNAVKVLLALFLLVVPFVFADSCTVLTDGLKIDGPVFLCKDTYNINQGILLDGSEVVLDCQGSKLVGTNNTIGVTVKADDSAVRSCVFEGFKTAVFVEDSVQVRVDRNTFVSNVVGIHSHLSSYSVRDNIFDNNLIDATNETVDFVKLLKPKEEPKKEEPKKEESVTSGLQTANSEPQTNVPQTANREPQTITGSTTSSVPDSVSSSIFFVKVFVVVIIALAVVLFFYAELKGD